MTLAIPLVLKLTGQLFVRQHPFLVPVRQRGLIHGDRVFPVIQWDLPLLATHRLHALISRASNVQISRRNPWFGAAHSFLV